MTEPIPVKVTRYRCPHCPRTGSTKSRVREHIGRCWWNPDARGCKTCKHFVIDFPDDYGSECAVGVDLSGHPACVGCGGHGWADTNVGAAVRCGPEVSVNHIGDGREVKPGPIVGCDRWEAAPADD